MNTGQMLLTIGAVILLGLTVITVNSTFSQHGMVLEKTEVGVYATSLATSLIQEATGRSFDENTVDTVANSATDFTQPASLGPETGEVYPAFDDFDDYDGLVRTVDVQGTDIFTVWATVTYVQDDHPNTTSGSRTYHKRIDIAVAGSSSSDTVRMSSIFSYWSFR